jgi:predicted deacetylase
VGETTRQTTRKTRRAVVSIHDVSPKTLPQTLELVELLESRGVSSATLLVVPGADWSEADLEMLRRLQASGHELAGHGWTHQCTGISSWSHRIHSLVISRDLGEHLSLDARQIADLIARNHQWFADAGLEPPQLYVPPAWGMGPISRRALAALPFTMYEYLTGVYHVASDTFTRLPLLGFEADTRWRRHTLRALNAFNSAAGHLLNKPLRIAIHPFDLTYHLAEDLKTLLGRPLQFLSYAGFTGSVR